MKLELVSEKINSSLNDKIVSAKEAAEIRDDILELSPPDKIKIKDKVVIKELTPDARTIISDLYAGPDTLFAFSQKERKLITSLPFQRVLPNFRSLPVDQQKEVLSAFQPIVRKFPNFFDKLAELPNGNYGKGFQFFFTSMSSSELGKIVNDGSKSIVGVVNPGSNVIKNPVLNDLLSPFGEIKKFDVGGMYMDAMDNHDLLTHEMAHVVHLNFLNDDQRDKIGNLYDHARLTNSFISEYAKTNPYEYFADSVKAYYNNEKEALKKIDPQMYDFIGSVYESAPQYGEDGNLFTDPENVAYTYLHTSGKNLMGVTVGRDSSLFTLEHFNGSTVSELALLGNEDSLIGKGSFGAKAAWKPWNAPVEAYGTVGATANAGYSGGKPTAGVGGFAGAGVNLFHFNAEVRENLVTNGSGPEVRVGYRIEF